MAKDIFGYEQTIKGADQLARSDAAIVTVNGKTSALTQTFSAQYGHSVEQVHAMGDPGVYFVAGKPTGTVQLARAVGVPGFLAGLTGQCGHIKSINLDIGDAQCGTAKPGGLVFENAIIQQVSISASVERITITESATIMVASFRIV